MLDPVHHDQRPIGELFTQLVDEGKSFARAEAAVYKAKARVAAKRSGIAAALGGAALVLTIGAVGALLVGLILSLEPLVGALGATLIVVVVALVIAGLLGMMAYNRFKSALTPERPQ